MVGIGPSKHGIIMALHLYLNACMDNNGSCIPYVWYGLWTAYV